MVRLQKNWEASTVILKNWLWQGIKQLLTKGQCCKNKNCAKLASSMFVILTLLPGICGPASFIAIPFTFLWWMHSYPETCENRPQGGQGMFLFRFFRCGIIVQVHCCEVLQKPTKCHGEVLLQVILALGKDLFCLTKQSAALATIFRVTFYLLLVFLFTTEPLQLIQVFPSQCSCNSLQSV